MIGAEELRAYAIGETDSPPASSWSPIDLGPVLRGEVEPARPTVGERADGTGLLYPGTLNQLYSPPEAGKGWFALHAAGLELRAGHHVCYLDFESDAVDMGGRLLALGVDPDVVSSQFHYVRPDEPFDDRATRALARLIETGLDLAFVDGITQAMAHLGLDPNSNAEFAQFHDRVIRPFVRSGACTVMIDHSAKGAEANRSYSIGAQHKKALVKGAAYRLEVVQPFGRGRRGISRVVLEKDSPGFLRGQCPDGCSFGELVVDDTGDRLIVEVTAPDGVFRPTVLMERLSRALEDSGEEHSQRKAIELISGKGAAKIIALKQLAAEGYVGERPDGQAKKYRHLRAFRDDRFPVSRLIPSTEETPPTETVSPFPRYTSSGKRETVVGAQGRAVGSMTVSPEIRKRYEAGESNLFALARSLGSEGEHRADGAPWTADALGRALGVEA